MDDVPSASEPPVIASSNRYKDLEFYCGKIYGLEEAKWRDIFPWEFPQKASRQVEEAFLQGWFDDGEIHMRGFRFLKQVWYCIAEWNFRIKMVMIANWWMEENKDVRNDPSLYDVLCSPTAGVTTFFFSKEIDQYGEKMLKNVIPLIQSNVKALKEEHDALQLTPKASNTIAAPVDETGSAQVGTAEVKGTTHEQDISKSVEVAKVGLAPIQPPSAALPRATENARRPRADSSTESGHVLPIQSRKRGNSYNKNHKGHNHGPLRYDPKQSGTYFTPQYQQSPGANPTYPGMDHMPPHSMHPQMRMPSGGQQGYLPSPTQQMPQLQGPPPPPGLYGNRMPQQAGLPFQQPPIDGQYLPQDFPFPQPQLFNPHCGGEPFQDRSNNRHNDRTFSSDFTGSEDMYGGKRPSNHRNSVSSRGNNRARGGKGSRGRNSFTGSRPQNFNFNDGAPHPRKPSRDLHSSAEQEFGYRRNSMVGQRHNWPSNTERPQAQNENMQPTRVLSGPGSYGPSTPHHVMQGQETPYGAFQPKPHERRDFTHPPKFNPRFEDSSDFGRTPLISREAGQHSNVRPPQTDFIHDENDNRAQMYPEKLLTRHHIGSECTHVRKLVIFNMPLQTSLTQIEAFFASPGHTVCASTSKQQQRDHDSQIIWLTFDDHTSTGRALAQDRKQGPCGILHIEVPKEYWDPKHERYPGHSHAMQKPRHSQPAQPQVPKPANILTRSPTLEFNHQASDENTPIAKLPSDQSSQKEILSGSTTPTASDANTPKKKGNKKKNKKQTDDLRNDAMQAAAKQSDGVSKVEQATSDAKSGLTPITAVQVEKQSLSKGGAEGPMQAMNAPSAESLTFSTGVPVPGSMLNIEAQTKPEPTFSPDIERKTRLPDVSAPEANQHRTAEGMKQQSFRGPTEVQEKAKGPEDGAAGLAMNDTSQVAAAGQQTLGPVPAQSGQPGARASASARTNKSPQKSDEEQNEDSFHTALGTPDNEKQGKKTVDRVGDESTTTEGDKLDTATLAPSHADEQPTPKTTGPSLEGDNDAEEMPRPQAASEVATVPCPSPTTSSKATKQVPVPQLPRAKIAEPLEKPSANGLSNEERQRSASGTSVPPTLASDTAPTTSAVTMEPEKTDITKDDEIAEQTQPLQPKKAEKPKGPAQTVSLSTFAKTQKSKAKKPKPQRGKGSIRGKPKMDDDGMYEAPSGSASRVVSGTATPGSLNEDFGFAPDTNINTIDEIVEKLRKDPAAGAQADDDAKSDKTETAGPHGQPTAQTIRDASPSKSRTLVHNIMGLFSSSKPATPEPKARDPLPKPPSTDNKSGDAFHGTSTKTKKTADPSSEAKPRTASTSSNHKPAAIQAEMAAKAESATATGRGQQPFRTFRENSDGAGIHDRSDSAGEAVGDRSVDDVGLGISTAPDNAAGTGVAEDNKPKKKKKKSSKKKKIKGMVEDSKKEDAGEENEAVEDATPLPSPMRINKAGVVLFEANGQDKFPDAASEDESQTTAQSEPGSEASTRTLGREEQCAHTPSSTATPSSAQGTPSKAANFINKQNTLHTTGVLVQAPPRRVLKKRNVSTSRAMDTATSLDTQPRTMSRSTSSHSGDEDRSENPFDMLLDKAGPRGSTRANPPMLYVYVGPSAQESQQQLAENDERRADEVVAQANGEIDEAARRSVDGDEKTKPNVAS